MTDWDETWQIRGYKDRVGRQETYLRFLVANGADSVLDVGGASFVDTFRNTETTYHMIDLDAPLAVGTGGYNAHQDGFTYDGETLPFSPNSYDVVVVGFVLHHAAQHTIGLLKQIHGIARKHVLILEDLGAPNYPIGWLRRNAKHQPGGVFRDDKEWRQLFDLIGFDLEHSVLIRRPDDPDDKPYRVMYHLTP